MSHRSRDCGLVPARSNPSIERTSPGKPGATSHVKRWASEIPLPNSKKIVNL